MEYGKRRCISHREAAGVEWTLGEKCAARPALRANQASLQAVLQSTADGILAVNGDNKVLYANQRFVSLWRIPPAVLAS